MSDPNAQSVPRHHLPLHQGSWRKERHHRPREKQIPYLVEFRGLWTGHTPVVLRPGSTREVSDILKIANETSTAIVPQGGNTGLVGGQLPQR